MHEYTWSPHICSYPLYYFRQQQITSQKKDNYPVKYCSSLNIFVSNVISFSICNVQNDFSTEMVAKVHFEYILI